MIGNPRRDKLLSQHIEVALVYKQMLGMEEAIAYLQRENIPSDIAEQVLDGGHERRSAPAALPASQASPVCRRRNRVHDAIVEAALKIERRLGAGRALALLKSEQVPDTVVARIMADGPRQLRARKSRP